jgi:uncharacterized protein (DUF302 family)
MNVNRETGRRRQRGWQHLVILAALVFLVDRALAADGLIAVRSPYGAVETMDRFEKIARDSGMNIFARIDHAAGAAKVGLSLRPTQVLVFGNLKGGTPFMECSQTVGIDLPLKLLVWEDATGQVWIGYNEPAWIGHRHGADNCPAIGAISKALANLVDKTIAPAGAH